MLKYGMLAQIATSSYMSTLKQKTSEKTDKRINILEKVLSTIRTTKMYVWEKYSEKILNTAREKEMSIFLKLVTVLFSTMAMGIIVQNVSLYFVLMSCVWMGQPLTATKIYITIGFFNGLSYYLTIIFPYAAFYYSQVVAALKRIQELLKKLEVTNENEKEMKMITCPSDGIIGYPKIKLSGVTIGNSKKMILCDVNVELEKGLTVVTGPASSGKSIFLLTILRQFDVFNGTVQTIGTISYAAQEPWIFPSTIRQNILFGSTYDPKRYKEVINACALQYDFNLLDNGDLTVVSERGINLSKGQQSRINLARAIYRDSDIYLLDDCLSSLDALVSQKLFSNCILDFLKDKVVVLVSSNLNFYTSSDNIIKIKNTKLTIVRNQNVNRERLAFPVEESFIIPPEKHNLAKNLDISPETALLKKKKIYGEKQQVGAVSWESYKSCIYFGGGYLLFFFIILLYILTQVSSTIKDRELNEWANFEENVIQVINQNSTTRNWTNSTSSYDFTRERNTILYIFTASVLGQCLLTLLRSILLFIFSKNISIRLHNQMIKSVLNATLNFFNSTFIGNIVNRFTRDLILIDENIPFIFNDVVSIFAETVGGLILISFTNVRFLPPLIVLFVCFIVLRCCYVKTGRALKRLDASTKSPVLGYLKATWEGLTSIKAYGAEKVLTKEFQRCQNLYTSALYCNLYCLNAFVFASDLCISIFIAVVVFQFFLFDTGAESGDVGMIITRSFAISKSLSFALIRFAELETQFTSVERAVEYTKIEQENKKGKRPIDWPQKAEIKYENVNLSINNYKVLKNINLIILPKDKIGVIGRTGAGKSSLISVLFNLYNYEGLVTIDEVDIKSISLDYLRANISVIPQDIMLLNGTMRTNIDPEEIYSDEEIWKTIAAVQLSDVIPSLSTNIKDLELSCGQKQLLSLARVLVNKHTRILILDEMVEKVDSETEQLINDIIDRYFNFCTVIKIAHRLKFVLNCDQIVVMDKGAIVEIGQPSILLQDSTSIFRNMFNSSGGIS